MTPDLNKPSPSPSDLAYIAGYFDGEGCVTIAGSSLALKITNTYPATLELIRSHFGGHICTVLPKHARNRTQYALSIYGDNAEAALRVLIPVLREKKSQALLALMWRELAAGEAKAALRSALSDLKRTAHVQRKSS